MHFLLFWYHWFLLNHSQLNVCSYYDAKLAHKIRITHYILGINIWVLQVLPPLKRISSSRFRKNEGKDGENLYEALLLFPRLLHLLRGDYIALCTSLSPYFL
jgi:hypothetical protein